VQSFLKTRSLRFWMALGVLVALGPIAASAVGGYFFLHDGVIRSFQDVAFRQRSQIDPTQQLRLLMWDALVPVDEFVDDGNPAQPPAYRTLRARVEATFAALHEDMSDQPEAQTLVERARDDWTAADRSATELISVRRGPDDSDGAALMERFHGQIAAAADRLAAVHDQLDRHVKQDHDAASLAYERSLWLAGIAAAVSLLTIFLGLFVIGRIIAASVDRLVVGAERFAEGDRDHRIDVPVPPELHRVAEEFNHMIGRIHDSEEALADLARRDGLTRLLNRRAFDDALAEMYARMQRFDEKGALLSLDIDHFKRVNDRHGHAAGDEVLRDVAQILMTELRPFDGVFRVGGEEFAALLSGIDMAAAQAAAERLRQAVAAHPVHVKDDVIVVTVSIGLARATAAIDPHTLTDAADAALYRAKAEGRNRVVMIDEGGMSLHPVGGDGPAPLAHGGSAG